MDKKQTRLRRARKTRARIAELKMARLCVYRTNSHIYAQVIDETGSRVLASASSLEADCALILQTVATLLPQLWWARQSLKKPRLQALVKLHLIVPASNTMVASRPWQMLPVKTVLYSNRS